MKARIKDVPTGVRFRTLLTGREGVARAQEGVETVVRFEDRAADSRLSAEVVVEAGEVIQ